ncbi:MBL fold metallo-hydrolase [Corallincola platygyrae]|uniref:MBL fold metallo-hydrolase n=1 Tax=Corallincola platygyrae TaxID=1193278 RepID=A0ABW4XRS5_9GAMM
MNQWINIWTVLGGIMVVLGLVLLFTNLNQPTPSSAAMMRQHLKQLSPQWQEGKFRNSLPQEMGGLFEMLKKQLTNKAQHKSPDAPLPVQKRNAEEFHQPPSEGLRLTWFGHSSVLIEIDDYRVLTDPVWGERASPFSFAGPKRFHQPPMPLAELPPLDAVVISHDHYDHLDEQTIRQLKDRVPLFLVPLGIGDYLEQWGVSPERIVERDWWGEYQIGSLTLTATPARHFSGREISLSGFEQNQTLWCGWSIKGPVHSVYYSGDTAMFPGFKDIGDRLGPFDVTMIETGAYNALWADVHIGPEQAIEAHRMVRGNKLLPVHWGTFDLAMHNWTEPVERVRVAAAKHGVGLLLPRPGDSVTLGQPQTAAWWPELPWETTEQAPIVSSHLSPALAMETGELGERVEAELSR